MYAAHWSGWFGLGRRPQYPFAPSQHIVRWRPDAALITADGSVNTSQCNDFYGSGLNLVQATSGNRPQYQATGFNGQPCITAQGAGRRMTCAGLNLTSPHAILGVCRITSNGYLLVHNVQTTNGRYIWTNGASSLVNRAGTASGKTAGVWLNTSTRKSFATVYGGAHASHLLYSNGVVESTTNFTGSGDPGTAAVNATFYLFSDETGNNAITGDVAELAILNFAPNASQIAQWHSYIKAWYSI